MTLPTISSSTVTPKKPFDAKLLLKGLRLRGRNPQTEALLKTLNPKVGETEFQKIWPSNQVHPVIPLKQSGERQQLEGALNQATGQPLMLVKPYTVTNKATGTQAQVTPSESELASMTVPERLAYDTNPQKWYEEQADWGKVRQDFARIKEMTAANLGLNPTDFDRQMQDLPPQEQMKFFGNAALWVVPAPSLKEIGRGTVKAIDVLSPEAARVTEQVAKAIAESKPASFIRELLNTPIGRQLNAEAGGIGKNVNKIEVPQVPGMPEAGVQQGMFGEQKVVTPQGKGVVNQVSMDEQLKLAEYQNRVAQEAMQQTLTSDPIAQARFTMGGKQVGLDAFISIREQSFPEYFTVKQAEALMPGHDFSEYLQQGTKQYNHVPKDVALDDIAKKFNMTPDELGQKAEQIRQMKAEIKNPTPQATTPLETRPSGVEVQALNDATGKDIASKLNVTYNGIQQGTQDVPDFMLFTDPQTGSTFAGRTLEEAQSKLDNMRQVFKAGEAKAPPVETPKVPPPVDDIEQEVARIRQARQAGQPPKPPQPPVTSYLSSEPPKPAKGNVIDQAKQLQGELEADVSIATKRTANINDPDVLFGRLALRDAQKLLSRNATLIKKIERGIAVSDEEIGVLRDKLAFTRDYYKFRISSTADAKKKLTDYIQENLPLRERGKLLDAVASVKDDKGLTSVIQRVDDMAEQASQRFLRVDIIKELRKARPKKDNGVLKGKFGAGFQAELDAIHHNLNIDRDIAKAKIADNIDKFNKGQLSEEAMLSQNELLNLAGIKQQNSVELADTLTQVQELKEAGRSARLAKLKAQKAVREARIDAVVNDVTGRKGLKPLSEALPSEASEVKESVVGKVFNRNYSFGSLMEKLSKFSKTEPRQSSLANLDSMVSKARDTENAGIAKTFDDIQAGAQRIFEAKNRSGLSSIWRKMTHEKVSLRLKLETPEGTRFANVEFTKGQLIKKYQEMLDPTLDKTFKEAMHWGESARNAVINALSPQEKAWAEYQMEFYQKYWDSINSIYADKYGVSLGHNPYYSPIRRNIEAEIPEDLLVYQDLANYASVLNGSLKARVANAKPLLFTDANEVFVNHIQQMEHFKSWVNTMSDLRSVFGSKKVRDAISQYHGRDILGEVDTLIDRFARSGVDRQHVIHALDTIRTNFSRSVLGLKPNIALQQLPTNLAYLSEMGVKDYVAGLADFWSHPVANFRTAMKSTYIKARYTQGFERDIQAAKNTNIYRRAFSGQGSIKDWAYGLMEGGDKVGVIPGWWAKYKTGLKKGLSDADAMLEANMLTDRTQNTSAIETLSTLQSGGSFWKLFTMFQSQPNKYFQIIANNARNLRYGRGSPAKAISSIALAWAVLPAMFQFIADGFQFKKERQARAVLLGPVNDLLVLGQISQQVGNWLTGETFNYQATPVTAPIDDLGRTILKGRSLWSKFQKGEEITVDSMVSFFEGMTKTIGEATGVPTPYMIRVEQAIRERNPKTLLFSQWAQGEPPPFEVAKELVPLAVKKLGAIDQDALDDAIKAATKDGASPSKIAEIRAKDWTYDITSLRTDISWAIRNLTDKEKAELSPIVSEYVRSTVQKDTYEDLGSDEQLGYVKSNPDFLVNQFFWGYWSDMTPDSNTPSSIETANQVAALTEKYNIPLNLIPAFDKSRMPPRELWADFFAYNNLRKLDKETGKMVADTAKREAFRRTHRAFSKWGETDKANPWKRLTSGSSSSTGARSLAGALR